MYKKRVTVLGSTGSIGRNTVALLLQKPELYEVVALTARSNVALLAEQAKALNAKYAVVADSHYYDALKEALAGTSIKAVAGYEALIDIASESVDWVMSAIVGVAGLRPTMAAVEQGAIIALANKECLVCAGELMINEVEGCGADLVPVDSEHSAIYQVFDFKADHQVERIILTASGGPFRKYTKEQMMVATPEQAVRHPNWNMGTKISIDSATMMNKGLELIEAYHLFPVRADQIDVVVHPESVVHSMVEYIDGSMLAQMGTPDMKTPISYALAWPKRMKTSHKRLSLVDVGTLHFEELDTDIFSAVALARESLRMGGTAPAVLNAANEAAVALFVAKKIGFLQISSIVQDVLAQYSFSALGNLEQIVDVSREVRVMVSEMVLEDVKRAA